MWRLLKWFWDSEPAPEFVAARSGRIIKATPRLRTLRIPVIGTGMPQALSPKDPSEVDWINFDFRDRLAAVGDSIASVTSVESEGSDAGLVLDEITSEDGVVSARWQAGTDDVEYTLVCEVTTVGGRTWTERGTVVVTATE